MIRILKRNQAAFLALIILSFLMMNAIVCQISFKSNSSQSSKTVTIPPPASQGDTEYGISSPPSTYPAYTGAGTPRVAQETLWRLDQPSGTRDALQGVSMVEDLPGTGYWTGTRVDLTVGDISEQRDWITNGKFDGGLASWVPNLDTPGHTGPAISVGTDTSYPTGQSTYGNAAYFRFDSASTPATSPPQSSSTDSDNTGDLGASTHWTNSTDLGGGTPHKYMPAYPGGTPRPVGASANWRISGMNGTATPNNRDGAWMFYVSDIEASDQSASTPQAYTVTFQTTYTYSFSEFPVSSASFKLFYRYYSTDFDRGPQTAGVTYPGPYPQDFTLSFSAYTASEQVVDQQIKTWTAQGQTEPGDSGWVQSSIFDLKAAGLFANEASGSFRIVIKLVVHMCVDDGYSTDTHTWCSDEYSDHNNEDSDYLFFYVDGVELTATVPQSYGADVNPDITQTITFDRRNITSYASLQFYYYVPSTFLCGRSADDYLYLNVIINSHIHSYSIKNTLAKNGWNSLNFDPTSDIGTGPGPPTITVTFSIVFSQAGWYAQGSGQSIWIDDVSLQCINYASATLVQLKCYDEEHGVILPWSYTSERLNKLTNFNTWQTTTTSSRFTLNSTSSAILIWLTNVQLKFYAAPHYQIVTPTFSIPTDATGGTSTVIWTINYPVNAISSTWNYTITIPNIPNWASNDWNVSSVKDSLSRGAPYVNFWTKPTAGSMKNVSIYTTTEDAIGTWVITCTSPNKITNFNVTNQNNQKAYMYYPGFNNKSRIGFTTTTRQSASSVIWVNYTKPNGAPVTGTYPNATILPGKSYIMPYWTIPTDAIANDHYIAMVKWLDTDAFNDEVGFAAHYIQVNRCVSVSSVQFRQSSTLSSSKFVVAGEKLQISVNVTDPLVNPSLALNYATLTIYFPSIANRLVISQKTLNLTKSGNMYYYLLRTDGKKDDDTFGGPDYWLISEAWMGGTGNRTFTINLFGNSTSLNDVFQTYQITGWFYILVDTHYQDTALSPASVSQEQGISFTLSIDLFDNTPGHNPAVTGITDSDKINNRTSGTLITDFNNDGIADTWNGSVFMRWNVIPANLTNWLGGVPERINDPNYLWNGTLTQKVGAVNRYEARIKIPSGANPTDGNNRWYYFNVTTTILDNKWGWKFDFQYMTLTKDPGPTLLKDYDNHIGCFKLDVMTASGKTTQITAYPPHTLGGPLQYDWKDKSNQMTRLYLHFIDTNSSQGFNSMFLSKVTSWRVESWAVDPRVPNYFGDDTNRLQWNLVDSATFLPDGITPDPWRENLTNTTTWGWFYSDFNWTKISIGLGTFESGLSPASFVMYVYAKITNETNKYRSAETNFYIKVSPNPVNLTIVLRYQGNPTFLDETYYPGKIPIYDQYYWGDILNFTIRATDRILDVLTNDIALRYYIYQQGGELKTWGNLTAESNGLYSTLFNTSDPSNTIGHGNYNIYFRGVLTNRSIEPIVAFTLILNRRDTQLWPLNISGVFNRNSVGAYGLIEDIRRTNSIREFDPIPTVWTVPDQIITFSVKVLDGTVRNNTINNIIKDANVSWYLRVRGDPDISWCLGGWSNIPDENGIYSFTFNLSGMNPPFNAEYGRVFELQIMPYKANFDSKEDESYKQNQPGSTWRQYIEINRRPIALIPIDKSGTPKWDFEHSQSNWKYNPIDFVVMDLITGRNVSGCLISYQIGSDADGYMKEYGHTGKYYVTFNTWPGYPIWPWVSGGLKYLDATISNAPSEYGSYSLTLWGITQLASDHRPSILVDSEGFLGPLTSGFLIILGIVAAVIGGYYSYKSYKFLTTPYVIRKIEESIDKISKDKKIAAGVMKSRDHLIFLEATELMRTVGIILKPPPEKKLPPPIEKLIPKRPAEELEKIPEIPVEIVSTELDKIGVRPEEKPLLLQQVKELGPEDRREFIESLIGEERFKQLVEELKIKAPVKKE